jgi:hypothetical protein
MSESQTAAEWQTFFDQRDAARAASDRMRCAALKGNESKAAAVRANWEPIRAFQQEQRNAREERIIESACCELVN